MMATRGRKRNPTKQICGLTVPNPPRTATHIFLKTDDGKHATVNIKDFDTLIGTAGVFNYIKRGSKGKVIEEYKEKYTWTGYEVVF